MSGDPQAKFFLLNIGLKKITAFIVSVVAFFGAVTSLLVNTGRLRAPKVDENAVQLIVSLAEEQPLDEEQRGYSEQYNVAYKLDAADSSLSLSYTTDYLEAKAKSVGTLGEGPLFILPKVGLDIKLVNNSDEALFLTEAIIEVISSQPDNRPLMAFTHHEGIVGEIGFTNDGWGEPSSLKMLAVIDGKNPQKPMSLPVRQYDHPTPLGTQYFFDISPLLEPYGILGSDLRRADALEGGDDYEAQEAAWAKVHVPCIRAFATPDMLASAYFSLRGQEPPSGDIHLTDEELARFPYGCDVKVTGTLMVEWIDAEQTQTQTIEFTAYVSVTPPEGLGSTGFEPTGAYDVAFKTSGIDYVLNVPLSQTLRPKDFDRFSLWMGAPQSSKHEFLVRLKYNQEKELISKPIRFDYLRPRENTLRD